MNDEERKIALGVADYTKAAYFRAFKSDDGEIILADLKDYAENKRKSAVKELTNERRLFLHDQADTLDTLIFEIERKLRP